MKKFNKILTVLVAFAMIVSSLTMLAIHDEHAHVHAEETAQQSVWRLKADLSSVTQGQFSFIFATDRPQTVSAPEVPTVSDGVVTLTSGELSVSLYFDANAFDVEVLPQDNKDHGGKPIRFYYIDLKVKAPEKNMEFKFEIK
jgi:hypothetical protein